MRYLSSISLAVVLLMALACTTAPAALTPNIDATVEARAKELVAEQVNDLPPNPDLAMDYFSRAYGYSMSGDLQLAIEDYTKAIELGIPAIHHSGENPLAGAYLGRGLAYKGLGQDAKADADKAKACSLDSQYC